MPSNFQTPQIDEAELDQLMLLDLIEKGLLPKGTTLDQLQVVKGESEMPEVDLNKRNEAMFNSIFGDWEKDEETGMY